jgi:PAS domain S-box-containing protein
MTRTRDEDKTKQELIEEIAALRCRTARLEEEVVRTGIGTKGSGQSEGRGLRGDTSTLHREPACRLSAHHAETSQSMSAAFLEACPDAAVVHTLQGMPAFVNGAFTRLFGWTLDELQASSAPFVPAHESGTEELLARVLRGERLSGVQTSRLAKDGNTVHVSVTGAAFSDQDGRPAGAVVLLRDITLRKQAQEAIRSSEEKHRNIIETLEDGYYEVDLDGNFVFVNDAVCATFGCPRDELIGNNYRTFMDEDNACKVVETFKGVFRTGRCGRLFDYEIVRPDGLKRSMSISVALTRDATGHACGFRGICRDITESKQAQMALASELKKFEALYDLALAMTQDGGLQQNLALVVEKSRQLLRADTAYIALHDGPSGELYMHTLSGIFTEDFKQMRVPLSAGLGGRVAATGKGLIVRNYFQEIEPLLHDVVRAEGLISGIAAPLRIGQTNLGVLYAFNRTETAFSKADLDTLSLFANLAAVEIKRAQAEREVQHSYDELEHRVEQRTSELHETNQKLLIEIADRRRAEEAFHQSEERYRQLVEKADDLIITLDPTGIITFVNPLGLRVVGYSKDEIVGKQYEDLILPEYRDEARRFCRSLFCGHVHETYHEDPLLTAHGSPLWLGLKVQILIDGDRVTGFQGIGRDVTERKMAEDRLRASEERYRQLYEESKKREELYLSLLNSSADAVIIYDMEGHATYVNPCFTRTFGWPMDEVQGKRIPFVPDSEQEATAAIVSGLIRHDTPCSAFESKRLTKDGRLIDVSISASTYRDHAGRQAGILEILRDVMRRKRAEQRLERTLATAIQLRVQAEAANSAKSEFLANMSHEFRTPLNAIIGFSEILEDQSFGPLNDRQMHYMRHVLSSGRHLLRLVSDILDLAKVESGKMEIFLSTVHVPLLMRDSLELFRDEARKQTLSLILDISRDFEDCSIQADEVKLRQVLFNLLSNAVKFTPAGGKIVMSASADDDEVRISVSDTGIGLVPEDHERIFSAFVQVDSTYSRFQSGTGLGLALTRRLVQLHAGTIWVESPGRNMGSTFTFTIPRLLYRQQPQVDRSCGSDCGLGD